MKVALRYTTAKLSNLAFDNTVPATNQVLFKTLSYLPPLVDTTEVQGILNNGRQYSNLLYAHRQHSIIISADEIESTVLTFLENFWLSNFKYISRYINGSWTSYIEVKTDGGVIPIEFLDSIDQFPEIKLTLTEKGRLAL